MFPPAIVRLILMSLMVFASTLIIGWNVIRKQPHASDEIVLRGELLPAARTALLVLCLGMVVAMAGDLAGQWAFGCR